MRAWSRRGALSAIWDSATSQSFSFHRSAINQTASAVFSFTRSTQLPRAPGVNPGVSEKAGSSANQTSYRCFASRAVKEFKGPGARGAVSSAVCSTAPLRSSSANFSSTSEANVSSGVPHNLPSYETVALELIGSVGVLTLARPKALNALNSQVMEELVAAATHLDTQRQGVGAIVMTGEGHKAFAAGADIKEMAALDYSEVYRRNWLAGWEALRRIRKPLIAAVNGYALGGGCELAMACDIILASDTASFGQPEVNIGVIPGMGATQRLTHAIGKSKAMELILTGERISARDAERWGLISRVVPADTLLEQAIELAAEIASKSQLVVAKAKECVNQAYEMPLTSGLLFERREFWSCFGLADQKEGMRAFVDKTKPQFKHQ